MEEEQDTPRAFYCFRVPNHLFEWDEQDLAFVPGKLVDHFPSQAHFVNQVGRLHLGSEAMNLVSQLHAAYHDSTEIVDQEHAEQKEREQENEARAYGCLACVRPGE